MNATLFDPGLPGDDDAPRLGSNGAHAELMKQQDSIRLSAPAHHNAPPGTSDAAARRIEGHAPRDRRRVHDFIRDRGAFGATDDEGESALGIKPQSYTPRRGELVALGLVVDSGKRRKTESGRAAAVWVTPEHAPPKEGGANDSPR
ncbi:MAG: hypothetical protein NTU45_14470 [Planctomycetota bacterium]|nr:hypothetical protein [Planctomycetota bacterium]